MASEHKDRVATQVMMDDDRSMCVIAAETPRFIPNDPTAPTQSMLIRAPRKKFLHQRTNVAATPTSIAPEALAVVFSIGLKPSPCSSLCPSLSVERQQRVPLRQATRTPTNAKRRLFTSTTSVNTCSFTSPDEGVCCSYSSDSEEDEAQSFADLYAKILSGQSPSFRPLFLVDSRHHHQLPKPKAIRPARPKSLFRSKPNASKVCASCGTRKTPLWRDSDDGIPYCNACGIRYKKYRTRCSSCKYVPRKDERTTNMCVTCGGFLMTC